MSAAPRTAARPSPTTLVLLAVCALGVCEWIASALAYRSTISDADIEALLATPREGEVRVGSPWLRARIAGALDEETRRQLAAPDEVGVQHLAVIVPAGASPHGLGLPDEPVASTRFGGLERLDYELTGPQLLSDWLEATALEVYAGRKRCSPRRKGPAGRSWDCRPDQVRVETVEIGYAARRCFSGDLPTDRPLRFVLPEGFDAPTTLRGHLGFGDFNARLRSDALASLRVLQAGELRAAWTHADDQGWRAFEIELPPGPAIELELHVSDTGSYDAKGEHRPRPEHQVCLEVRSLSRRGSD